LTRQALELQNTDDIVLIGTMDYY